MTHYPIPIPAALRRTLATAERNPRLAVTLARRLARRRAHDPWALLGLGLALLAWERLIEARAPLEAALVTFTQRGCTPGILRCDYGLLQIDRLAFARPNIDQELAELAERAEAIGERLLAAYVRIDQARQLNQKGTPHVTIALIEQVIPALQARGPATLARLRRVQAVAANRQGHVAEAESILHEVGQIFERRRMLVEVARTRFELGAVMMRKDITAASAYNDQAEAFAVRADLPLLSAQCRKAGGVFAMIQGRYDQALQLTITARDGFHSLRRRSDMAVCLLHIGNIYFYTAHWEAAAAAYLGAEAQFEVIGNLGNRTLSRRNRVMVYRRLGRPDAAWKLLAEVEREALTHGYRAEVAEVWSEQASLLADAGRFQEADELYVQAHALFVELGDQVTAAGCRLSQGWLALDLGDLARAEAHFADSAAIQSTRPHRLWRLNHGLGYCAEARGETRAALGHYLAASAIVASLRSQIADEGTSSQLYTQAARLHTDALRLAAQLNDPAAVLTLGEGQRALTLRGMIAGMSRRRSTAFAELSAQLTRLLDQPRPDQEALDAALNAYATAVLGAAPADSGPALISQVLPTSMIDLGQIRQILRATLGSGWGTLAYSLVGATLQIIYLSDEGEELTLVANDAELQRLIRQASHTNYRFYTYNDAPFAQGRTTRPWDGLRRLAELLLPSQLLQRLDPQQRLLIIPSGPLHGLPWAALRLDDAWLVERTVLQVLPSLSLVPQLVARQAQGQAALLLGCSDFGGQAAGLPMVGSEIEQVAAAWPGPQRRLLDSRATCAALRAMLADLGPELAVLHLATHAQLLPGQGRAAHLKLYDADLSLNEIATLQLGGAIAVLSACDGAAADVLPGEEVLSLSWAFMAAGSAGVIASLWPLADGATQPLIAALYAGLRCGDDPVLALARAQRDAIAAGTGPQVWGGLLVTGCLSLPMTTAHPP